MLACHPRHQRHHFAPPPIDIPSTSPSHIVFDNTISPNFIPCALENIDDKLLQAYLTNATPQYTNPFGGPDCQNVDQYMTDTLNLQKPDIRIQQSTPQPQLALQYSQSPNSIDSAIGLSPCYSFNGPDTPMSGGSLQTPTFSQRTLSHQRFPSSSSVGSSAPASPHHGHGLAPHMPSYSNPESTPPTSATLKFESSHDADESRRLSNHLPTPSDTPIQDTFAVPQYQSFHFGNNMDPTMAAAMAYDHGIIMDQHNGNVEEDLPGFSHSERHSVSSYGRDSPATPHTAPGDDFEDRFKVPQTEVRQNVPKFDRTMSDIYQDELYNPGNMNSMPVPVAPKPRVDTKLLSPFRAVNERVKAAQNARSQSPASATSGGVSPFRQGSPLAPPSNSFGSPLGFQQAAQPRDRPSIETQYTGLKQQQQQRQVEPKTISPKDAMLDYQPTAEDAKMPLFPEDPSSYGNQYENVKNPYQDVTQGSYDDASDHRFSTLATAGESWNGSSRSSSATYSNTPASAPSQPDFTFRAPHGMQFHDPNFLSASNLAAAAEENPEFPAHLTSMESSASEAPPTSSQNSNGHGIIARPPSTQADSGTYTCTYHGCSLRFETPQKLQKHKREGHRQNPVPTTPGVGSGMTSAAILARNSQAGPHKCERINPTTGKPCNTIFSRPYDLTRHEDTIHNIRKQKVRCALCVEEKTFSRNDALTRHMRVVHPEVDFPGKHRRRGAHD